MSNKRIFRWELVGFFVIATAGSLAHFCFEWSGSWKPVALFCAVNESVWEHLKIGFWPAFFYALIEYFTFGKFEKNFWVAKTVALYTLPLLIVIIFYSLVQFYGEPNFWMNIGMFLLAIAISQLISYRIITSRINHRNFSKICTILLILLLAAFSLLTYFPPQLEPFFDYSTGIYGIPK